MRSIFNVKWKYGAELSTATPFESDTTAILAIKDTHKGNYLILPDIFHFDQNLNNFKGYSLGKVNHWDYWYLLEEDLLKPLRANDKEHW